ncbi:MAG: hypothetical protein R3F17_03365 [Planctomycetota bacterium]
MILLRSLPLLLALPCLSWLQDSTKAPDAPASPLGHPGEVSEADLRATVAFLASDELQGREAYTPEARKAAEFLAAQLKGMGLTGLGPEGAMLLEVPFERTTFEAAPDLVLVDGEGVQHALRYGEDFRFGRESTAVDSGEYAVVHATEETDLDSLDGGGKVLVFHGDHKSWRQVRRGLSDAGWLFLIHDPGVAESKEALALPRQIVVPAWTERKSGQRGAHPGAFG